VGHKNKYKTCQSQLRLNMKIQAHMFKAWSPTDDAV
jgi:hypothetical protein